MTPARAIDKRPKKWILRSRDAAEVRKFAKELGVSPIVAGLLLSRGYGNFEAAERFLKPTLQQLHDPMLMRGMTEAVARVLHAIDQHEPILIYGDYDVDGTTGTAVLLRALRMFGATAGFHVPHRFTEGYGIQQPASGEGGARRIQAGGQRRLWHSRA